MSQHRDPKNVLSVHPASPVLLTSGGPLGAAQTVLIETVPQEEDFLLFLSFSLPCPTKINRRDFFFFSSSSFFFCTDTEFPFLVCTEARLRFWKGRKQAVDIGLFFFFLFFVKKEREREREHATSQFEDRSRTVWNGVPRIVISFCILFSRINEKKKEENGFLSYISLPDIIFFFFFCPSTKFIIVAVSQLQLSWGKLRGKPATRWFGESFAPMPSCDNAICTSGELPTSTTVSHGFVVARYRSPTFGSHCQRLSLRTESIGFFHFSNWRLWQTKKYFLRLFFCCAG